MFTVPQKYQELMIEKPVKELYQVAEVVTKLEQIFLKMREEPQGGSDSESLVDAHLEGKLNQMTVLTNYLFLVIQRIKNIQGRGSWGRV